MKRLFNGFFFLVGCGFFALAGAELAKGYELIGILCGFCFGVTACNFMEMHTRYYQSLYIEKLEKGYRPPED